ncbi:MAG: OstA-like protein [Bacteroidales bacterium]|nr:OstA-like protein [Bacteroidales bacterium]MDD3386268.1 OstA-like protein [Bacteroidales bacterium]
MKCWRKSILLAVMLLTISLSDKAQEAKIVDFTADLIEYNESIGKGIQRLIGNVWMKHKNLELTCDSAYLDQANSRFKGYSRVHIIKADTLHVYSRHIDYNGRDEISRLEGQVRMENGVTSLKAPRLDYNMKEEIAWYYGGGQIIDSSNTVESFWGYYFVDSDEFVFNENVIFTNPDNTLVTDSMKYNSKTEQMWFDGPSQIFSDTNYISCNRGFYDSRNRISTFTSEVFMQAKEQLLWADSLVYNQDDRFTEAFDHVKLQDTIENVIIQGERLFYDEDENSFRMTENVYFITETDNDSLFMYSDTLFSIRVEERNTRKIQAYPRVQFFREDIQGRCDSLGYVIADSLIQLFKTPVVWKDNNQMTADSISIFLVDDGIGHMVLNRSAFLITREDSLYYNQIKGKKIIGYFSDGKLSHVDVTGNGESLFYPKDGEEIIGLYKAVSSSIAIRLLDGKINKISFLVDPDSKLLPIKGLTQNERFLEGFLWLGNKRPFDRQDVSNWK